MNRTKLAIAIAMASGLSVAVAHAQSAPPAPMPSVTAPAHSVYEYGNYDYYYAGAIPTPAPAHGPTPADSAPAAAPSCNSTESVSASNSTSNSTGNSSNNSCNNSCGCDSCDHRCHGIFGCGLFDCHECSPLQCCDEDAHRCFDDCSWCRERDISVYGWADGGIEGNTQNPASHYNGPVTFPDRDDGQFNQLYGVVERTAPKDNCGCFIGGRVDFLYGSDYIYTTAAGLDGSPNGDRPRWGNDTFQYGAAMPQAYAETDYNDLKVKWGHFYSIIGYEMVPAVGNFFYSLSYTRQYGEPFTHTGVLASKPIDDNWTWYAGIDNGWNAFDCDSRANFLGGLTYSYDCWGSLAFAIQTGDDSEFNLPGVGPFANRTMYSIVWSRDFTSRLTYVLQHDLGVQTDAQTASGTQNAEWYGINQYLFYRINCCWSAGIRAEWLRDDDGFIVTGLRPGNPIAGASFPGNFYEVTLGLNYKPNANIIIRPEVRWDWYDGLPNQNGAVPVTFPFNDGTAKNQFLIGIDGIVQF